MRRQFGWSWGVFGNLHFTFYFVINHVPGSCHLLIRNVRYIESWFITVVETWYRPRKTRKRNFSNLVNTSKIVISLTGTCVYRRKSWRNVHSHITSVLIWSKLHSNTIVIGVIDNTKPQVNVILLSSTPVLESIRNLGKKWWVLLRAVWWNIRVAFV